MSESELVLRMLVAPFSEVWMLPLTAIPPIVWLASWIVPTAGLVSHAALLSTQENIVPPKSAANCSVACAGAAAASATAAPAAATRKVFIGVSLQVCQKA